MISLESLYLKGETLELGYKQRMRMAYALAKQPGKSRAIAKDIREAYEWPGRFWVSRRQVRMYNNMGDVLPGRLKEGDGGVGRRGVFSRLLDGFPQRIIS